MALTPCMASLLLGLPGCLRRPPRRNVATIGFREEIGGIDPVARMGWVQKKIRGLKPTCGESTLTLALA